MKHTTIEKQGMQVPVGTRMADGSVERGFAFKGWRSKDEREIGAIRDDQRAISAAAFVSEVLALLLTRWCGHSFEGMSRPERRLVLNRAPAADIYHAWVQLRREVLGTKYDLGLTCGMCRGEFVLEVELGSIDLLVVADDDEQHTPYALRDGIEYRSEERKVLTLKPVPWSVYEIATAGGSLNTGDIKLAVLAGAVHRVEGVDEPVHLTAAELDLTKYDLEALSSHVDDIQPGPDLSVQVSCPHCATPARHAISWLYDSFFSMGGSSLGGRKRVSAKSFSGSLTASPASA